MKRIFSLSNSKLIFGLLILGVTFVLFSSAWAGIDEWTTNGPDGATIRSIAFSPNYANDNTIFSGGDGIYKSTNGGMNWTHSGLAGIGVVSIAFSPDYANDNTIFAGSGDYFGNGGIYKTTDGGQTWTYSLQNIYFHLVVVSPNYANDKTVFAGASYDNGLRKSTDGGLTWTPIDNFTDMRLYSIALSPDYANDNTLFVCARNYPGDFIVYKSTDGGQTWTNQGLNSLVRYFAVSPDYVNDQTIFAICDYAVYKSTDGGQTWIYVSSTISNLWMPSGAISPNYASDGTIFVAGSDDIYKSNDGGQTWTGSGFMFTFRSVAISPNYSSDNTVFAGAGGIYKSTNQGQDWNQVNDGLKSLNVDDIALSHNLATDGTIFAGTVCGIYKSTDKGQNWTQVNNNIIKTNVYSVALSPNYSNDNTVFAGTYSAGLYKSTDGGANWTQINSSWRVEATAVSPNYANDNTLFVVTHYGDNHLHKSTNGGQDWTYYINNASSVIFSPNYASDNTLFAFINEELYKSTDGGLTWDKIEGLSCTNPKIAVSPNYAFDSTVIMSCSNGTILKTIDGGSNWVLSGYSPAAFRRIAFSPDYANDNTVFGNDYYHVYKSTTGGKTWTQINSNLANMTAPDVAISPDYANDETLYAPSNFGVLEHTFGPDITPPITSASPSGGTYYAIQNVILTCDDAAGSGCQATYYCLGSGCNPATVYSGAINLTTSNTLRFYSKDNANNDESEVKTETYAIVTHAITASAGSNGSISPDGSVIVNHNGIQDFTVTPNTGYYAVMSGTCGGNLVGSIYKTNPITADCTVIANFEINTYTVTPIAGIGGSINPATPQTVNYNQTTSFTVTPGTNYQISSVIGCGGNLVSNTYTTGPITANCSVTATFSVQGGDTPGGLDVTVNFANGASVTYDNIDSACTTSLTEIANPTHNPPNNFRFASSGYFDISTDCSYSGNITVTLPYNENQISGQEQNLKLFHWENSRWVDCTVSVNTSANTITGQVTSLSPFGIGYYVGSGGGYSTGANINLIILIAFLTFSAGLFILRKNRWSTR